jgi:pimeloyl-ACP methyl ester carboxylesterase
VPFVPTHDVFGSGERLALLCHGILGSRQNWRGFARRLAATLPAWQFVTVDHRNHGDARGAPGPHTLDACANDLVALGAALGRPPEVVVGHSFGGKVALTYAERASPALRQVWVLDASPEAWTPEATRQNEVSTVLAALDQVPQPLPRRNDVVEILTQRGFSPPLARWMTTNLRREGDGYVWRFDLPAVHEMLADYLAADLWHVVEAPRPGPEIVVVRAARSDRWTDATLDRLRHAGAAAPTRLETLRDAGHWVHVDAPEALLAMLVEGWPG